MINETLRDRPAKLETIEVTDKMIEIGACVLWDSGAVEHPMGDADRSLVQEIFLAMILAARLPS